MFVSVLIGQTIFAADKQLNELSTTQTVDVQETIVKKQVEKALRELSFQNTPALKSATTAAAAAIDSAQLDIMLKVLKQVTKMNKKKKSKKNESLSVGYILKNYVYSPVKETVGFTAGHLAVFAQLYVVVTLLCALGCESVPGGKGAVDVIAFAATLPVELCWKIAKNIAAGESSEVAPEETGFWDSSLVRFLTFSA